jgi:GNAT superfamily N-acetyltransferase
VTGGTVTRPLTPDLLPDAERLFATSKVTAGCSCMWFLLTGREFDSGYAAGNRAAFADLVSADTLGVLAYRDGEPVGWVATGPRSRYGRLLRSPLLKGRDAAEDGSTWLVPCFYVRRDARRQGVTDDLLAAALRLAVARGAESVEAVPLAGPGPHPVMEAYVGTESMFANAGFEVTARPSARRAIMRLALPVPPRS